MFSGLFSTPDVTPLPSVQGSSVVQRAKIFLLIPVKKYWCCFGIPEPWRYGLGEFMTQNITDANPICHSSTLIFFTRLIHIFCFSSPHAPSPPPLSPLSTPVLFILLFFFLHLFYSHFFPFSSRFSVSFSFFINSPYSLLLFSFALVHLKIIPFLSSTCLFFFFSLFTYFLHSRLYFFSSFAQFTFFPSPSHVSRLLFLLH